MTSRYACCAFSVTSFILRFASALEVIRRRFLRFLNKPVQHDEHLIVKAQDEPGYPAGSEASSALPNDHL